MGIRDPMKPDPELDRAYAAATQSALVTRRPAAGHINATGADHLDLLHRLTTNTLSNLSAGSWRFTVLTNSTGRIVDRIQVVEQQDHARLITSPGRAAPVQTWLEKYVFFQDDVSFDMLDEPIEKTLLLGPTSRELLADRYPDLPELKSGEACWQNGMMILATDRPFPGFEIHADQTVAEFEPQALDLGYDLRHAARAYEALRIEQGLPEPGSEIHDEIIPLEIGLSSEIDFGKGCYIGQEIIARMESRGQLAKQLVGLLLPGPLQVGQALISDGRSLGQLTSTAYSPRNGWVGLALLSRRNLSGKEGMFHLDDRDMEVHWQELPLAGPYGPRS